MGLIVEQRERVLILTIDRPEVRNAYDPAALNAMSDALTQAKDDRGIGAVVLAATGDQSFSSGFDLKVLATGGTEVGESIGRFDATMHDLDRIPMVAAVAANAIGGGFEMMTKCDLAVAGEQVEFGLPEVARGLIPGGGATLLPARIPLAIAMELAIAGLRINARRAYELGLVNRVVPAEQVLDTAIELASAIAANGPFAVRDTRRLLWTCFLEGAGPAWEATRNRGDRDDDDRRREREEGMRAFREKRAPRWD